MTERRIARPAEAIIVLAYRAHSRRDAEAPYAAHCTSTYAKIGDDWRMVQHQQAPAP
ncbi:hypothetical protein SJ05684_c21980 [Sinorhizobium sojae CCBAU 05684]|uniref:SnoaL-like domain-containing protein n=2 Tax=Sinorhizobium sojae TaxID=716925 RepID=A0A249PEG2_9HYPH|nr:hypothetical protein SJ05684_c21980 [Sinorhizobium sojae CCBAU 05684]